MLRNMIDIETKLRLKVRGKVSEQSEGNIKLTLNKYEMSVAH